MRAARWVLLVAIALVIAAPAAAAPLDTLRFESPRWMPYEGACDSLSPMPELDSLTVLLERMRYPETFWELIDTLNVWPGDTSQFIVDLGGCAPCAFRKWVRDRARNVSCNATQPINLPRPADPVGVAGGMAFQAPRVTPMPVRRLAVVEFELASAGEATLELYDLAGRQVRELTRGVHTAGRHLALLDAGAVPPGLYFLRLRAGDRQAVRRVVVMR